MACVSNLSFIQSETLIERIKRSIPVCGSVCVQGSVRSLLHKKIRDAYTHPQFITDVMKPMQIESIIDQDVRAAPE